LLSDTAGRVLTLDFFAQQFFSAVPTERPELLKKAQAYIGTLGAQTDAKVNTSADYYVKAMERILSKGEAWLVKEQAR
jgi:protein disulfide-isomerase A6